MKKLILSLKSGIFYTNVTVQLWDRQGQLLVKRESNLPENEALKELYDRWRSLYSSYYQDLGTPVRMEIDDNSVGVLRFSLVEFKQTCRELKQQLNRWLSEETFLYIEQQLRKYLDRSDEIQVIIESEDEQLRRFPWHLWQFFRDYQKAEIALSLPEYERVTPSEKAPTGEVKILGLLGNSKNIEGENLDIQTDKAIVEQLPGAKARFLVEPNREIVHAQLWEQTWDIFFFAGHSGGVPSDSSFSEERGKIYINQDDRNNSLTVSELENALRQATQKGLQLAIFNSCDSLGLAWDLAQLNIPQTIAMREAVPDEVAQAFLRYFLKAFASGKSCHLAVREARERLQGLEDKFPCASWLPVICQNPTADTLTWRALRGTKQQFTLWRGMKTVLLASLAVTGAIVGTRSLGWMQASELKAFDGLMRMRPQEESDERLLVITVGEPDIQYQDRMGMERTGSLSDLALEQLLEKLEPYQPSVIGVDIYHDFPYKPSLAAKLAKNKHFIAPCEIGQTVTTPLTVASPPGISPKQTGFTDFPRDPDDVMRRQLLLMTSSPSCNTSHSLSFRIALNYLAQKDIFPGDRTSEGYIKINNAVLKRFTSKAGGYHLPASEALGYQILINYRAAKFAQVSLRDILSDAVALQLPDLVKNRIILIGVAKNTQDSHLTPYSKGAWAEKIPGVFVHAHQISQILSAVEDGRPLLWWWSQGTEILWIWSWSIVAGAIAWLVRQPIYLGLAIASAIALLFGLCWLLLVQGTWIPFVPCFLTMLATSLVVFSCRIGLKS
ncbi:CHASE2 domain-containing protein [Candidatus Gracilibacteria bacterium]|nr:CHASE2 domain-containing protein [Candidatus Gracilibacteria bacterium]